MEPELGPQAEKLPPYQIYAPDPEMEIDENLESRPIVAEKLVSRSALTQTATSFMCSLLNEPSISVNQAISISGKVQSMYEPLIDYLRCQILPSLDSTKQTGKHFDLYNVYFTQINVQIVTSITYLVYFTNIKIVTSITYLVYFTLHKKYFTSIYYKLVHVQACNRC
jgi:hypothetical protein